MTRTPPAPKLAAKAKKPKKAPAGEVVHAVKGFDEDLKCLGFQYEIGKTYEHEGPVHLCSTGFHSIEGNPLDVLDFYPLIAHDGSLNRFASVVASGEIKRDGSSKICSARIAVGAELKIPDLIASAVKFVIGACKGTSGDLVQAASGYSSQLAASGDYSKLAASGYSSQLAASGYSSQLAASGDSSQLAASGDSSQLAASGTASAGRRFAPSPPRTRAMRKKRSRTASSGSKPGKSMPKSSITRRWRTSPSRSERTGFTIRQPIRSSMATMGPASAPAVPIPAA